MSTAITTVNFDHNDEQKTLNALGMRPMQDKVWQMRNAQYLLLKSPPASGKSRALMYAALHKLNTDQVKKCIVAVPERTIGSSFKDTDLRSGGFHWDWHLNPEYNLCIDSAENTGNRSKVEKFKSFMASDEQVLLCTHATLRFAFDQLQDDISVFDDCMIAVDEFHHVSVDDQNRLGALVTKLMQQTSAHIMPMTGSYFRGDTNALLRPEHEALFSTVVYTYYEQMSGYEHLKKLLIGHHFYEGKYIDAIADVLDHKKKTIIHIPHIGSSESTKDKHNEVDVIIDALGETESIEDHTGFKLIRHKDGTLLRLADLVDDDSKQRRDKVLDALRHPEWQNTVDIIVALGMGKEGFDLPPLEAAITVGYRGSLTEIIQIIGRITRDYPGKLSASFINLVAKPVANQELVVDAVNDLLKAISASLLMEQVMAPKFKFTSKKPDDGNGDKGDSGSSLDAGSSAFTINIAGLKHPTTERSKKIVESDISDLIAAVCQDSRAQENAIANPETAAEKINKDAVPRIIQERYPDISAEEAEEVRNHVVAQMVLMSLKTEVDSPDDETPDPSKPPKKKRPRDEPGNAIIEHAKKFMDVHDLSIDLIDSINPFKGSYEVIARALDTQTLARVRSAIRMQKKGLTPDEAMTLLPRIKQFIADNGKEASLDSANDLEVELAEAMVVIRREVARKRSEAAQEG